MQLTAFLPYVHDELPVVPQLIAIRAVRDALREFCYRTTLWRQTASINLVAGQKTYAATPSGAEAVAVIAAELPDNRKVVFRQDMLGQRSGLTAQLLPTGEVQIDFDPAPYAGQTMQVQLALRPAPDGTEAGDVCGRFIMEIGAKAKQILVSQRNQAWSAPEAAPGYYTTYAVGVSNARREAETGTNSAETQVQLRKWV